MIRQLSSQKGALESKYAILGLETIGFFLCIVAVQSNTVNQTAI
jgi:hypothetical protein